MCCGVLCESSIALLMAISAWAYSILEVEKDIWATLLLPLMIFDFCVFCLGLRRLCLGYSWLLRSEIYIRLLLLYSFCFRFMTACCIILVLLEILPVSVLLIPSCFSYAGGCYLNTKAKDRYTWFRLHVWDLTVLTVCLNIFFIQEDYLQLFPRRSSSLLWPVYILCISLVGLSLLMWYILHTDDTLRHDTLLRLAVSLLLHLSISLLLASLFLGRYLDEKYFLLSPPALSYDSFDHTRHIHQTRQVESDISSSSLPSAGASSSIAPSSFSLLKNLSSSSSSQLFINTDTAPPLLPSLMDFLREKTTTSFSSERHRRNETLQYTSSFSQLSPPEETRNITDTFLGRKRSYHHHQNDLFLAPWMKTNLSSHSNVFPRDHSADGSLYPFSNVTFPSISAFIRAVGLTRWNGKRQELEGGEEEERKRIRGEEQEDDMMAMIPAHHIISPTYWAVPLIFALILLQLLSGSVVIFLMASHTYMTSTPPPSSPLFVSQRDSRQEEGTSQRGRGRGGQPTDEERRILLRGERTREEEGSQEEQQAFPPLSKDMRVTLERVGHHFYRLLINYPSSFQDDAHNHPVNKNEGKISPDVLRKTNGRCGSRREGRLPKETEARDHRSVEKKLQLSLDTTSASANEGDGRVKEGGRKKKIEDGHQQRDRYTAASFSPWGSEEGEEERNHMKWEGLTRTRGEEEGRENETMIEDSVCIHIEDGANDRRKATASSLLETVEPETRASHDQRHGTEEEEGNSRSSRLGEEEERQSGHVSDVVHRTPERDEARSFAKENKRKSELENEVLRRRREGEISSDDSLRFLGMEQGDKKKQRGPQEEESEEGEEKREKIEGKKDRRRPTKVDADEDDRTEDEVVGYKSGVGGGEEEVIEEERKRSAEGRSRRRRIEVTEEESNYFMISRPSQDFERGRRELSRERKERGNTSVQSAGEDREAADMREGMHARTQEGNISCSVLSLPGFTTGSDIDVSREIEEQSEKRDDNDSHHDEDNQSRLLLPRPPRRYLSPSQHATCVVEEKQADHEEDKDHDCIISIPDIDSRRASTRPQRDRKDEENDLHCHSHPSSASQSPSSSERQHAEESTSTDQPGGGRGSTVRPTLTGLVSAQQESHMETPGLGVDTSPAEPDTCMICCQQVCEIDSRREKRRKYQPMTELSWGNKAPLFFRPSSLSMYSSLLIRIYKESRLWCTNSSFLMSLHAILVTTEV